MPGIEWFDLAYVAIGILIGFALAWNRVVEERAWLRATNKERDAVLRAIPWKAIFILHRWAKEDAWYHPTGASQEVEDFLTRFPPSKEDYEQSGPKVVRNAGD